jgi:hypothetical protein
VRFDKPTMDFISSGQFYRSSNSRGSIKWGTYCIL